MLNFLKRRDDFIYDQAVILNVLLNDLDSRSSDIKKVEELESKLKTKLPAKSKIDGHEFGEGEAVIYMYGPSADEVWEAIKADVTDSKFDKVDVTLQYGLPDDPNTKDKKFTA